MNTLLVIDMQSAWLDTSARFDKEGVIARINQAASIARARGEAVLFIRHCSEEAQPGSPGWQLHRDLLVDKQDGMIDKTACDAFAGTALLDRLKELGTHTLTICGLASEFCVDTTLRAALSQGFDVIALSDAHTTGERAHLSGAQIVAHHNWVWENLALPQGRRIRVCTVAQAYAGAL